MTLHDADFQKALAAIRISCAGCDDFIDDDYCFDGEGNVVCRKCFEKRIDQAEARGEGNR